VPVFRPTARARGGARSGGVVHAVSAGEYASGESFQLPTIPCSESSAQCDVGQARQPPHMTVLPAEDRWRVRDSRRAAILVR